MTARIPSFKARRLGSRYDSEQKSTAWASTPPGRRISRALEHAMIKVPDYEHFEHQADMGIRGHGRTLAEAFEQAALALTAVVVRPDTVEVHDAVTVTCRAGDDELLFLDWLNAVIYEMSTRRMVFGRFSVRVAGGTLDGEMAGEPLDVARHQPGVEVKAATPMALSVSRTAPDHWVAQCVVDV